MHWCICTKNGILYIVISNLRMSCWTTRWVMTHTSLRHTVTHCNTLQHTATIYTPWYQTIECLAESRGESVITSHDSCMSLQHTSTHCNTRWNTLWSPPMSLLNYTLQHPATHTATHTEHTMKPSNILLNHQVSHDTYNTATHCSTLQHNVIHLKFVVKPPRESWLIDVWLLDERNDDMCVWGMTPSRTYTTSSDWKSGDDWSHF